ncbi:hypothetical protein D9756_010463 [Leucocoprinus leucothites]|uniref:Cation/H+ exchanger transmembrane domain-containing protein n=1 Tax=Leucocoprinus leucothites TaxID=201217 RepID=A0A8H5CWC5_9AGAR|nr:hypothetical protein D9756_010463 [Leucoagaricus leucothites]
MRVVLATGLFAIGVDLPKLYMYKHMKGLLAMVVPTMAIGLLKVLFSRFDYVTCLVLAACLTPTDPIVSAAIVGGQFARKYVPDKIRHIITAESASNDSLAYPFLSISIYLTLEPDRRKDIRDWILVGWLYQVILGILIGAIIGYLFSHIMKFSHNRGYINRESYVAQYLALSIFIMGIVNTIGSDDLLAVFAAGCAINWDGDFITRTEGEAFASVIEYILNCGCFFYIGAWLPWADFTMPELGVTPWRLVVLCLGILFLRRIPAVLTLYRWVPEISNWKEALFCGHFGPMGVGAIFISTLAIHRLPNPRSPPESQEDILATVLHPIVGFVVLVSIVVHGLSIPLFSAGRKIHSRILAPSDTSETPTRTFVGSIGPTGWMISVRRSIINSSLPLHRSSTNNSEPQFPPPAFTIPDQSNGRDHSTRGPVEIPVCSSEPCTSTGVGNSEHILSSRQVQGQSVFNELDLDVDTVLAIARNT